jgi:hemolysin III
LKGTGISELKPNFGEELANAITHGVGVLLSVAGFIILFVYAGESFGWSLGIYGVTLVLLYLASTLYHSLVFTRAGNLFRKFDHMAIFLLIAGTYTPFCLTALEGWLCWTMLGTVWGLALIGIVLKSVFTGRYEWLSVSIYILTGWLVVLAIKPVYEFLSFDGFVLLISGGLAYTVGTVFYIKSKIRWFHSIWHLWVLAGSTLHFFAVLTLTELL